MHNGIKIKSLTKSFVTGQQVVTDLSLDVKPGHAYCLLGHNGAGKSTTIKILLGLVKPTSGNAWVHGHSVADNPDAVRQSVAYVPENVALYGELTARENLEFFQRLAGTRSGNAQDHDAILTRAGLPASATDVRVALFSKGMRQKLALAIAIARDSDVLILDEPMSGLDPFTVDEVARVIVTAKEQGKAVFMVTHELTSIEKTADMVGFMHQGRLTAELSREQILGKNLHTVYKSLLQASARA